MLNVHNAMTAFGLGLLVLFFAAGIVKTCGSFAEARRPEHALKLFIRFVLAKGAVQYGLELMLAVFDIVQGIVSRAMGAAGTGGLAPTTLPQEIVDKINAVGFWSSIPLWAVTLLGGVYGRMFRLYFYAALAPIPLATFAGEPTSNVGRSFVKSYAGVCLEGAVIALACIIFSAMASAPPAVDSSVSAVTAVWSYVAELIFNLLILVGAVKASDRVVREMMGL